MEWHLRDIDACLAELVCDPATGLSSAAIATRLATHGRNELLERGGNSPWRILWEQFTSTMALILMAAAGMAALVGSFRDTLTILAIVILFALLGFVQEYRAERAIRALKRLAVPVVRVRRDGKNAEIPAIELVAGDIVMVEPGNLVPADCRVIEAHNLRCQESLLTGEADAVEKSAAMLTGEGLALGDRTNMLYMGTMVSYGRAMALVVAIGMETELGRIADLLQQVRQEWTPLQRRLDQLGKALAILSAAIAAIVFVLGMVRGENLPEMLMTAVSVAVAAIPEGLPAVVTITLAVGAQRMLRKHALIRKLPAVETLGSVTVICTDKTGTLTENRMMVTELVPAASIMDTASPLPQGDGGGNANDSRFLLMAVTLCNDAVLKRGDDAALLGDPTETALLVAAAGRGLYRTELEQRFPRQAEIPFDSTRKRMITFHAMADAECAASIGICDEQGRLMVVKGALDSVMALCDRIGNGADTTPLGAAEQRAVEQAADRLAAQGRRVLAVAWGIENEAAGIDRGNQLSLLGLVAMMDPPRNEARSAVAHCISAGIRPVMITGDHPLTARAIARETGIGGEGRVLTGGELDAMGIGGLAESVADCSIYARVSPEHKLMIVEALQQHGEVVAMTGDGVNDAPALKRAGIGVAMGAAGTDVAREAADMVLLDDNFATIVAAVEEGRTIYDNIRKFIVFSVSGNLGKILAIVTLPFLGLPNPLTPLQILWLNLLTDGLLGLGMGMERAEPDIMQRPPISPAARIFDHPTLRRVALTGLVIGGTTSAVAWYFWRYQYLHPTENWQTVLFTSLVSAQIGQAMALRSFQHSFLRMGLFTNPVLLAMVVCVLLLQGAAVYLPSLHPWFRTVPLFGHGLVAALVPGMVVFAVLEVIKSFLRPTFPDPPTD
jgi:Ca2+-transporting ATPase